MGRNEGKGWSGGMIDRHIFRWWDCGWSCTGCRKRSIPHWIEVACIEKWSWSMVSFLCWSYFWYASRNTGFEKYHFYLFSFVSLGSCCGKTGIESWKMLGYWFIISIKNTKYIPDRSCSLLIGVWKGI